jgi:hypothetical protein
VNKMRVLIRFDLSSRHARASGALHGQTDLDGRS